MMWNILKCPVLVLSGAVAVSIFALAAAFGAEAFLGLEPCILCIYQRWPFAIVAAVGGIALIRRKRPCAVSAALSVSALAFLINSTIAFYHTGIEQKWWASALEGCAVPNFGGAPQSILENIMSAPTGRCDEPSWFDPIFGLTMANYNVVLCLGLAAVCAISLYLRYAQKGQTCHGTQRQCGVKEEKPD